MTLPAFAAERRHPQHGACSYRSISAADAGAQQQTRRPPLRCPSTGQKDGQTAGRVPRTMRESSRQRATSFSLTDCFDDGGQQQSVTHVTLQACDSARLSRLLQVMIRPLRVHLHIHTRSVSPANLASLTLLHYLVKVESQKMRVNTSHKFNF